MKKVMCLIISLLLFSCSSSLLFVGNNPVEYYYFNKKVPEGKSIKLYKDGWFTYTFRAGWLFECSFGYWDVDSSKSKLILKSMFPSTDTIPLIVKERYDGSGSAQFTFNTKINALTQWSIVVNGKEYALIPDSILSIEGINEVDSFFVKGYEDYSHTIPLAVQENIRGITYYPHGNSDFYQISFPDSIDYRIYHFIPLQDALQIKGKNLYFKSKGWNTTVKLQKRR